MAQIVFGIFLNLSSITLLKDMLAKRHMWTSEIIVFTTSRNIY